MIWHESQNHHDDCYFCAFDLVGLNKRNKKPTNFTYPSFKSAVRPLVYVDDISIPVFKELELNDTEASEHQI